MESDIDKTARLLRRLPIDEVMRKAEIAQAYDQDLDIHSLHISYLFIKEEFLYQYGWTQGEFFLECSNEVVSRANRATSKVLANELRKKIK